MSTRAGTRGSVWPVSSCYDEVNATGGKIISHKIEVPDTALRK